MKLGTLTPGLAILLLLSSAQAQAADEKITVFKTPTCGCCGKWVDHLKANGFDVTVKEVTSTAETRRQYGVPDKLQSCHTAVVNGYTVEGHVPAADIHNLLKTHPQAVGLAVPGMPLGAPGMEQGARRNPYTVLLFTSDGTITEFQKYPGN